jgi:stage V sporulation protein AA
LDVIQKIHQMDATIQVNNIGETDFIIDYQKAKDPHYGWQWAKTIFVCIICFFGASFAIMTFNNDVSIKDAFGEIYRLVMGQESSGFTILELSYSVGLAIGIIAFFNHFSTWKLNTDPTPLEVEMRVYEDNISKTVIQNDSRKEKDIDVS